MATEIAELYMRDLSYRKSPLEASKTRRSVARTSSNTMLVATGRRASRGAARCAISCVPFAAVRAYFTDDQLAHRTNSP